MENYGKPQIACHPQSIISLSGYKLLMAKGQIFICCGLHRTVFIRRPPFGIKNHLKCEYKTLTIEHMIFIAEQA